MEYEYCYSVGDLIRYQDKDAVFAVIKIDINPNQHGIDLGYTTIARPLPHKNTWVMEEILNQFIDFRIKHEFYEIIDKVNVSAIETLYRGDYENSKT